MGAGLLSEQANIQYPLVALQYPQAVLENEDPQALYKFIQTVLEDPQAAALQYPEAVIQYPQAPLHHPQVPLYNRNNYPMLLNDRQDNGSLYPAVAHATETFAFTYDMWFVSVILQYSLLGQVIFNTDDVRFLRHILISNRDIIVDNIPHMLVKYDNCIRLVRGIPDDISNQINISEKLHIASVELLHI